LNADFLFLWHGVFPCFKKVEYHLHRIFYRLSYLFEVLKCLNLEAVITGSAQLQITRENLKKFAIPIPSMEKQQEIVTHIQSIRTQAQTLQQHAEQILADAKAQVERMILGGD
jgi:type I restriction enzyme, S subunit